MRVGQFLPGFGNGAARYCLLLSKELVRRGHEVTLYHSTDGAGRLGDLPGVEFVATDMRRERAELRRIAQSLRERRIDVIHTHMSRANAFGVLLKLLGRVPAVAAAHARHLQIHWPLNDLVIAPSQSTAAYHHRVNLVPWRKLRVIPNFADLSSFPEPTLGMRASMREEFGIAGDAFIVGSVGNFAPHKNQSGLVRAIGRLRRAGISAHVVLIGVLENPGEEGLVAAAISEFDLDGMVIKTGMRRDVSRLLCGLDVYVQNSRRDELPLAVLEAMATGLPVVGTRTGGIPEVVADGDNGFIVAPDDEEALARRIGDLWRNPDLRAAMGRRAMERARGELSPETVIPKVESVLAEAARLRDWRK